MCDGEVLPGISSSDLYVRPCLTLCLLPLTLFPVVAAVFLFGNIFSICEYKHRRAA